MSIRGIGVTLCHLVVSGSLISIPSALVHRTSFIMCCSCCTVGAFGSHSWFYLFALVGSCLIRSYEVVSLVSIFGKPHSTITSHRRETTTIIAFLLSHHRLSSLTGASVSFHCTLPGSRNGSPNGR